MRVTPEEQKVIEAALVFANLRRIRSVDQAQKIFMRLPLVGRRFNVIPRSEVRAFRKDQTELRYWLERIDRVGESAREEIAAAVADRLGAVDTRVTFDGERVLYGFALSGVQAGYAYAVGLILDGSRDLTSRLRQCTAPGCGRFRLDLEGKPRKYCNEEHRRRADAAGAKYRVRKWRKRKPSRTIGRGKADQ